MLWTENCYFGTNAGVRYVGNIYHALVHTNVTDGGAGDVVYEESGVASSEVAIYAVGVTYWYGGYYRVARGSTFTAVTDRCAFGPVFD